MLATIIVNYRSESKTIDYVKNELGKVSLPNIVVVVNNAATPDSDTLLATELNAEIVYDIEIPINKDTKLFILSHPDNLGFAKGNNLGATFIMKYFAVKYLLFSNNDIRLITDNAVERLIKKLEELRNVGLIGPRVIGLKGENQSPEPYYPFSLRYFWRFWLVPLLPKKLGGKLLKLDYAEKAEEGIHYKIMGSFFVVKAADFITCDMMDPNTFLYGEEIILTERMRRINREVYYYPLVSVLHEHGITISKYENVKRMRRLQFESESYYYRKYRNTNHIAIKLAGISLNLYSLLKGMRR